MDYQIRCTRCGRKQEETAFRCSRCNSILEVKYYGSRQTLHKAEKNKPMTRYSGFLPVKTLSLDLGEGGTALKKVGNDYGCELYLKVETANPTKTFKDRGSAVEMTKAVELGVKSVCCASTGNMGLSVAYYAKHAGIKCTIFISRSANKKKIEKIRRQGARIVKVDGDFNRLWSLQRSSRRRRARSSAAITILGRRGKKPSDSR